MALTEFAERELQQIGAFDKDADYNGLVGRSVLELVAVFAKQGHSGTSAHLTIDLFNRVARYGTLAPLKNPALTKEYLDVDGSGILQSTRIHSVFSSDGGNTWYDIDKHVPFWKALFGVHRSYLRFDKKTGLLLA
jgi:hypothetical protein